MKSLELLKKYLYAFGILHRVQSEQFIGSFLRCVHFSIFISNILTNVGFFAFKAQTVTEYSESSFYVLCSILDCWWYLVYVSYSTQFNELFDDLDNLMRRSKQKFYRAKNRMFTLISLTQEAETRFPKPFTRKLSMKWMESPKKRIYSRLKFNVHFGLFRMLAQLFTNTFLRDTRRNHLN